jgi:predicted NodU family carbamoyl transferase
LETTTIYKCNYPSNFEVIYKNLSYDPQRSDSFDSNRTENEYKTNFDCDIASQFDIGVIYGVMTDFVINASAYDSGKLMGLSSYGKEDASVPPMLFEDTLFANANLFKNDRSLNTKNYPQTKDFDTFEKKANYAYAVQKALEKVFVHRIKYILEKFPDNKNIVFSGGCALNILGNSLIKENFPDINFYVDPIANDACQSYGAAMYYHHIRTNDMKPKKIKNLYWGPKYDVNILEKILELEIFKINYKNAS